MSRVVPSERYRVPELVHYITGSSGPPQRRIRTGVVTGADGAGPEENLEGEDSVEILTAILQFGSSSGCTVGKLV